MIWAPLPCRIGHFIFYICPFLQGQNAQNKHENHQHWKELATFTQLVKVCPFWGNKFIFVWNGQDGPKNVWEGEAVMILTYGLEQNLISIFDYWKARLDKCSLPLLAFVVPNSKLLSEHSKPTFPRNYTCWTRPQICIFKRRILHDKESVILAAFLQATESVKKRKELSEKFCFSKLSLQRCRLIFG